MKDEELKVSISFLVNFFNETFFIIIYYQNFNFNEISFLYIMNEFHLISYK